MIEKTSGRERTACSLLFFFHLSYKSVKIMYENENGAGLIRPEACAEASQITGVRSRIRYQAPRGCFRTEKGMKRAVFFDIDGTLWNDQMQIPESTVEAVRALRGNGNYAFLCSGRSRANIRNERLLGIGFDGVIASCGAHIDFHEGMAYEYLIAPEKVEHLLEVLQRYRASVILEGPEYLYLNEEDFLDDPYADYLRGELGENLKSIRGESGLAVNKLSAALREGSLEPIVRALGEEYQVIAHNESLIEVVPAGHSKATGIERVCGLLGIPRENTYAFGDSANDLEMLRYAAHGIAMGNGTDEAKRAAEYITTDIDEDGIKNGLLHYGLI